MIPEGTPQRVRRKYTTGIDKIDRQIAELSSFAKDDFDRGLLVELMTSVCRLGLDHSSTGDLKLLNSALKELRYAFKIFHPYRHIRKVATFGSARMASKHPAYKMAKQFGRQMAKAKWMVITGAASGIMRAGHEGAGKDASFGLNIRLPFEQGANLVIANDAKLVNCKYFFTRKLMFIKESHATALFPGGFGTLDEGFESLTLVQTGKSDPRPIVFVESKSDRFWQPMLRFFDRQLLNGGMISKNDKAIYRLATTVEEAVEHVIGFYRVYHSLRYVGRRLVIRLNKKIPDVEVTRLNRNFKDLLTCGEFVQTTALPEEAGEKELKKLPRLIFAFNRREYGRLHQLIYRLNAIG